MEYLSIALKTILFLTILVILLKFMGKREIGQLNTFDVIIFFMISELFSMAIEDKETTIIESLIPIGIIALIQIITSYIVLKSNKMRKILEEDPSYIIKNGQIDQEVMKKERYNLDDLMQQIRTAGVDSPIDIEYAILENSGTLSVIQKGFEKTKIPFPLIKDGKIEYDSLNLLKKDEKWLLEKINKSGYSKVEHIFLCLLEKNDNLYIVPINHKSN